MHTKLMVMMIFPLECDKSILKQLILLFKNSTKSSYYPGIWKRSNIKPVHKRMINYLLIATDQYLYYPYLVKFLKK